MSAAFLKCLAGVLAREAGYQRDPRDPGNWTGGEVGAGVLVGTNLGVSAPVLRDWRGVEVSADDMLALTRREAEAIYRGRYWEPIHGDELPLALAFVTLDAAVNSGIGRASKWLQGALAVPEDGSIGAATVSAASGCGALAAAVQGACARRLSYLKTLPAWPHFGRGWESRVDTVQEQALALIPQEDFS